MDWQIQTITQNKSQWKTIETALDVMSNSVDPNCIGVGWILHIIDTPG